MRTAGDRRGSTGPRPFGWVPLWGLPLLFLAPGAGAAFLQAGYDAARTGNTPDPGPAWDDVAFTLRLPGSRFSYTQPLVFGGAAYVRTGDMGYSPELSQSGIWRIDLATAEPTLVLPLEPPDRAIVAEVEGAFASDGERFYVLESDTVRAYPVAGGSALWSTPLPDLVASEPSGTACGEPAVAGGVVYFFCEDISARVEVREYVLPAEAALYVIALDARDGTTLWVWHHDAMTELAGQGSQLAPVLCAADTTDELCRSGSVATSGGIAVIGDRVVLSVEETGGPRGIGGLIAALDTASGELQWMEPPPQPNVPSDADPESPFTASVSLMATGDERAVFARLFTELMALNPARGEDIWDGREAVGERDAAEGEGGSGFAFDGHTLFATSFQSIYRVEDAVSREHSFYKDTYTIPPGSGESWQASPLVLADGVLYGRAGRTADGVEYGSIHAVDAATMALLWRHEFQMDVLSTRPVVRPFEFGLGDGVVVVAGMDGSVTVIGRTSASPVTSVGDRERYPSVGSSLSVDLSGSGPGVMGPPTSFRADWGDGTASDWQASPLFEHAYGTGGDRTARFFARNDAGQSSSDVVVFHVGQRAPNLVSSAFSPERQEQTFFLLGLVITLIAALVSVAGQRRRHGRLGRELRAVEDVHQRTRHDPLECEAALRERKARAQGLLADRRLTDSQFTVLTARIDELARQVRLGELDERMRFLPMGMVETLRSMLADGRIERWEREHFLLALEREDLLTPAQKEQVRRLIDGWFERDSSAART